MPMMANLRAYIAGLLAVVLVLTGHSMAMARGMPGANGYAEYCIGESSVMVPVDDAGNPTGPAHICPEFSLSLLDWVASPPIVAAPSHTAVSRIAMWHEAPACVSRPVSAVARTPPVHS